tara:strand:+ start:496 stop:1410 length:915 start_codon:yes stop_codon:yes gene_type:complete
MKIPACSQLVVRTKIPSDQLKPWKGKHPTQEHYDFLLNGNVVVRSSSGELVAAILRNVLSEKAVQLAEPTLHYMRRFTTDNRSQYGGAPKHGGQKKADGTISKSARALNEDGSRFAVPSCLAGYFERQGGRHPFCRATAFTSNYPDKWATLLPLIDECGEVYRQVAPLRYKAQMEAVSETPKDYIIGSSPFTTVTVNNSVPAAYHQDGGDLKKGTGILLGFEHGSFDGFELVVPEYRFAVRVKTRDVLLFNPLVWHGNIPPYNQVGEKDEDWYRISVVLYFREHITGCLPLKEEVERAKQRGAL